ncbi:hypothetical protein Tsubulata_043548 [Turnera subulata]|uniref:Uncharacterized protein n=1 Tax=Turnera subulata TaxID=218843 RepID=A0A9Q0FQB9_9ROSI|nr:hypothetical protein Tsubulata_043548 [Turnera subulata]
MVSFSTPQPSSTCVGHHTRCCSSTTTDYRPSPPPDTVPAATRPCPAVLVDELNCRAQELPSLTEFNALKLVTLESILTSCDPTPHLCIQSPRHGRVCYPRAAQPPALSFLCLATPPFRAITAESESVHRHRQDVSRAEVSYSHLVAGFVGLFMGRLPKGRFGLWTWAGLALTCSRAGLAGFVLIGLAPWIHGHLLNLAYSITVTINIAVAVSDVISHGQSHN